MKSCLHFFLLWTGAFFAHAQLIPFPNEAKFKVGDNIDWAQVSVDDRQWKTQPLGASWPSSDTKDSVYAWYRIKIVIPSSIRNLAISGKGIKLNLGKIDDVDQTYFNGILIGHTGSFPPDYDTKWETTRRYIIPPELVAWDKENIIAVRVYNQIGGAGMYEGPYGYGPVQWSDYVSTQHSISEAPSNGFITSIKFVNSREVSMEGIINYWVATKDSKVLFTETKPVHLNPSKGAETIVTFSNYQPVNDKLVKVGYQITENGSSASLKSEQLYLAVKKIELTVSPPPKAIVPNKVANVYASISFEDVHLKGYLGKRLTQNLEERLLKVDEDGLMGSYLQRPGIHPWAGEHVGKYLEAACNVWKNTHDVRLKNQMDRMVFELVNTQLGDGYLGTYTPDKYWTSWDVWSHKYNLYGLLAYYKTTGYLPALEACKKMGDLLCATFGSDPKQLDIISAGTHVGMAATSVLDPMVELYRYTGDKKYLDFCYYIIDAWEHENGPRIISQLLATGKVNKAGNGKAYEMISNFLGLAEFYRLTGDERFLKPVLIAWQDIVDNRLYITGTTSAWEYFQEDGVLPAAEESHMGEGCVTTTWLQWNQSLFDMTGDVKFFNQIENSVYNHLLAAENPQTGCVSYYTPLMGKKPFTCNITCCQSSVPRGIALIPAFTFGNVRGIPTVMTYEAATYKDRVITKDRKVIDLALRVQSDFPESSSTTITVTIPKDATFALALRVPFWSNSFSAKVGKMEYNGIVNDYLTINRQWKSGEIIQVSFDQPIHVIKGGKNYPDQIAFQRGPQVLAFDDLLNAASVNSAIAPADKLRVDKPVPVSGEGILPSQWIGKQVYEVALPNTTKLDASKHLRMVPFADAGQSGGSIKVWLPFRVSDP